MIFTNCIDGVGRLYKAQIWGVNTNGTSEMDFFGTTNPPAYSIDEWLSKYLSRADELKPVLLLDNCYLEDVGDGSFYDWHLSETTLSGTNYYKIDVINGEICVVNEENYVAPAPQNYTLYPLNK